MEQEKIALIDLNRQFLAAGNTISPLNWRERTSPDYADKLDLEDGHCIYIPSIVLRENPDQRPLRNALNVWAFTNQVTGTFANLGQHNWGSALAVPDYSPLGIYTEEARNCAVLIMNLTSLDIPGLNFRLLSHLHKEEMPRQVEDIINSLAENKLIPEKIITSPRDDTPDWATSEGLLRGLVENQRLVRVFKRRNGAYANGFVSHTGWALSYGRTEKHRQVETGLW